MTKDNESPPRADGRPIEPGQTLPTALLALADRCEREASSRELDAAIGAAVGAPGKARNVNRRGHYTGGKPVVLRVAIDHLPYTASLDAAITLVPSKVWSASHNGDDALGSVYGAGEPQHVCAATPALALCAAALKVRAAIKKAEGHASVPATEGSHPQ